MSIKCNTIALSTRCIATVFVPKVESGELADVPKVELGKQIVDVSMTLMAASLKFKHDSLQRLFTGHLSNLQFEREACHL